MDLVQRVRPPRDKVRVAGWAKQAHMERRKEGTVDEATE